MSTESSTRDVDRRIHILGIGNIGKLFAHALATKQNPAPVTLLLHRPGLVNDWEAAGKTLDIVTKDLSNKDGVYEVETITEADSPSTVIANLIVATKAAMTVSALSSVKHRLTKESTILFAQNGMGTVEEVTEKVFPDKSTRPQYLNSVNSHGIYYTGPFSAVHAGFGYVAIGTPSQSNKDTTTSATMINEILSAKLLSPKHVDSAELLCIQLEKLTVNAMMNPLTVLFDCKNGDLFTRKPIYDLMLTLLSEVAAVYRSLPELQEMPDLNKRFGDERLKAVVMDMSEKTGANTSSMLQDVRAGRETEIDYINGYIVRRGKEVGVECAGNQKVIEYVKKKVVMTPEEIGKWF